MDKREREREEKRDMREMTEMMRGDDEREMMRER